MTFQAFLKSRSSKILKKYDLINILEASQDASSQTVIENGAEFSLQRSTFKVWKYLNCYHVLKLKV